MKTINEYIIEKLHLNKDISVSPEKKADDPTTWEVGDIVVKHSGYNMVIIDFYEIIKKTGKSFIVKQLKDKIVKGDGQRGESVPIENEYTNDPDERLRINKWGYAKIDGDSCSLWNGEPVAFDHMD